MMLIHQLFPFFRMFSEEQEEEPKEKEQDSAAGLNATINKVYV